MWFSDLANKYALCGVPNSKSYLSSSSPAAPPPTKPKSPITSSSPTPSNIHEHSGLLLSGVLL